MKVVFVKKICFFFFQIQNVYQYETSGDIYRILY